MGRLSPIPHGEAPPLGIVTAPIVFMERLGSPMLRVIRDARRLGISDLLNAYSRHINALTLVLFVRASNWLLFFHLLASLDLVQERAKATFAHLPSSISLRIDLPDALSLTSRAGQRRLRVPLSSCSPRMFRS